MEVSQNKKTFLNDWTMFEKMWLIISTITMIGLSIIWKDSAMALISGVTGIIGVVLCAKGKVSTYIFATVNVALYAIICYQNALYGFHSCLSDSADSCTVLFSYPVCLVRWYRIRTTDYVQSLHTGRKRWKEPKRGCHVGHNGLFASVLW